MDHFDLVAFANERFRPLRSTHDAAVVFDSYSLARQRKKIKQPVKRDRALNAFRFTVQCDFH